MSTCYTQPMLSYITPYDFQILDAIQNALACPFADAFFSFVTQLGDSGFIWIVIACILTCIKRFRVIGITALVSIGIIGVFGEIGLKSLVGRPRPFIQDPSIALLIPPPSGFSFPSMHAGSSFAVATVICSLPALYKSLDKKVPTSAKVAMALSIIGACVIAFSRLYVQVHFPSDVFIGTLFGIASGLIAIYITPPCLKFVKKRFEKHNASSNK